MFLRAKIRKKDGKEHRYWSVVENRRVGSGRVVQRHVLYLGEINSSQELAWRRSIEVLDEREETPRTVALFPEDRIDECAVDASVVRLRLSQLRLCRPRVWGSCWLALKLWQELELDRFWSQRLPRSRKGTRWEQVLFVLVAYRLLSPGSEWRLHRQWFEGSALADLLGADESLSDIHKLYSCHDRLLAHKSAVFEHLVQNAQEATPPNGEVRLRALRKGGEAVVEIADTGCGMDPKFIQERLFRPFDTTKGNAGMGIGVFEARHPLTLDAVVGDRDVMALARQVGTQQMREVLVVVDDENMHEIPRWALLVPGPVGDPCLLLRADQ